jgi:hypothetical protein
MAVAMRSPMVSHSLQPRAVRRFGAHAGVLEHGDGSRWLVEGRDKRIPGLGLERLRFMELPIRRNIPSREAFILHCSMERGGRRC